MEKKRTFALIYVDEYGIVVSVTISDDKKKLLEIMDSEFNAKLKYHEENEIAVEYSYLDLICGHAAIARCGVEGLSHIWKIREALMV